MTGFGIVSRRAESIMSASVELCKDQVPLSTIDLSTGKKEWSIGRSLDCDINLADSSISRRHARIFADDDGSFYIEDLGSTHGTVVCAKHLENDETFPSVHGKTGM